MVVRVTARRGVLLFALQDRCDVADMTGALRRPLLGTVGAHDVDISSPIDVLDPDGPRAAAHFAVLNEGPVHIGLDIDVHVLPAVWASHNEALLHAVVIFV
jgi:hypothetical protein